jgi:HSP20 family molecular chaperone IbpA
LLRGESREGAVSYKSDGRKKKRPDDKASEPEGRAAGPERGGTDDKAGGVTRGVLRGLGKMAPGLTDLFNALEKSEVFQERLSEVDAHVERELERATALKRQRIPRGSIIPPRTTLRGNAPAAREHSVAHTSGTRARRAGTGREATTPPPQREVVAEVFDEGDRIKVIAEMPGVTEKAIHVDVEGDRLVVSARSQTRRYREEIRLPCPVASAVDVTYRNGVMQAILNKLEK